jgi:hypothetical protein
MLTVIRDIYTTEKNKFILIILLVFGLIELCIGFGIGFGFGRWAASLSTSSKNQNLSNNYPIVTPFNDVLIHPETTPEIKWVKMTKKTRDLLLDIYAYKMEECSKFMEENDKVTIGESAILWLIKECVSE